MPTTVVYRHEWSEFGEDFRLDIIPRATADLPGGFAVVTLPKNFVRSWKVEGADFPSEKPWGLMRAPGLSLDLNLRALGADSDLQDLRTYLQEPTATRTIAIDVDGTREDLRVSNVVILYTNNGDGGTPTECVFVGCQRLLPGPSTKIQNVGSRDAKMSTEITFAHAAMHVLESIPTAWVARRAIADETPLANAAAASGAWKYAYNLIYYDPATSRVHVLREAAPASQRFYLYNVDDMFTDHMADLMSAVYEVLLRGAITSPTFTFKGYEPTGNPLATSPPMVPRYKRPDYTVDYGVNALNTGPLTSLYLKGVIEEPEGLGFATVGGWYSELSEKSIYQWDNCWDMLKDGADTCKATVWQVEPDVLQINVLPILETDHDNGARITLTASDILGGSLHIDQFAGLIRKANVSVSTSGGDDLGNHEAKAIGIRAEEEVTTGVVLHNQVPLWNEIEYDPSDGSGELVEAMSKTIAYISTLTTDTLYFVDTPFYDPTGSNVRLTTTPVPIMVPPRVDIRRAKITDTYTGGYDFTAFTPLPTTSTPSEFPEMIEGAVIEMQRNACLPHVLASFLVDEFGTGNATSPVTYEIETGRKATQKVKLRHVGSYIQIDPDTLLPDGESGWLSLPDGAFLVGWSPDSKTGTVKLLLMGYDL